VILNVPHSSSFSWVSNSVFDDGWKLAQNGAARKR
jgi:hypothetical protein